MTHPTESPVEHLVYRVKPHLQSKGRFTTDLDFKLDLFIFNAFDVNFQYNDIESCAGNDLYDIRIY